MKNFMKALAAISLIVAMAIVAGCKPEDDPGGGDNPGGDNDTIAVVVTTLEPSDITTNTAICGAEVMASEGVTLVELGVCWSTEENPTSNDDHLSTATWDAPFTCTLTDLEPNTEYHVRAYALMDTICYYGEDKRFTTEEVVWLNPRVEFVSGEGLVSNSTDVVVGTEALFKVAVSPNDNSHSPLTNFDFSIVDGQGTPVLEASPQITEVDGESFFEFAFVFDEVSSYTVAAVVTDSAGMSETADLVVECLINGYVDLGLPSGTLWAVCNVGANTPEDYGTYFAWGETATKIAYHWSSYLYSEDDKLTRYCPDSIFGYDGFSDHLTVLLPEDDAATANWGSGWSTPTGEQWNELYQNTDHSWVVQNGVNGRLFTASNGNSLFLPASGYRNGFMSQEVGRSGAYLSSLLYVDDPTTAWSFLFFTSTCYMNGKDRAVGQSVRPVRSPN